MQGRRARRQTAAEKRGYRWMQRLLRAMDAAGKRGTREAEVVVHSVGMRKFRGEFRDFVARQHPAAREALAMLHNGSMPASVHYGKPTGAGGRYAASYTVTLSAQW